MKITVDIPVNLQFWKTYESPRESTDLDNTIHKNHQAFPLNIKFWITYKYNHKSPRGCLVLPVIV